MSNLSVARAGPVPGAIGPAAQFRRRQAVILLLGLLLAARFLVAAFVPLVPDEAYYALWAQGLAFGYLDHPPMIALFIRAGVMLFGDNPLGVRFFGMLATLPASWFIAEAATRLLADRRAGWLAALLFNLTPMGFFGMALATPDAPLLVFASAMLYCAARLIDEDGAGLWIAMGLATGLALQSKYSAVLLAAGFALAMLVLPDWRRRLAGPRPWLALGLAVLVFAPNLVWNAQNGWATFAKQGGRTVENWHFAPGFLIEMIGAQLGLASPLIFLFAVLGFAPRFRPIYASPAARRLLFCLVLVPTGYFVFHALRARVEGNWPGFLYPALAILAAGAMLQGWPISSRPWNLLRRLAIPVALVIIALGAMQACFAPLAVLGPRDPILRMTRGWPEFAADIDAMRRSAGAAYVLTDNYQLNAELARNMPGIPVAQINERERYRSLGETPAGCLEGKGLLIGNRAATAISELSARTVRPLGTVTRRFGGKVLATVSIFEVDAFALCSHQP